MTTLYKLDLNMTSNTSPSPYLVSSSGTIQSRQPYKCFNNTIDKTSCYHSSKSTKNYVQIYLGKKYIISKLIFNMRRMDTNGSYDYRQKTLSIYGSNDGINFNLVNQIDVQSWNKSGYDLEYEVSYNNINNYSYYKFEFIPYNSSGGYIDINEISLYYKKQNVITKTHNKYIGGGKEFSLDTPLLDIKNNVKSISLTEIVTELKNINEPCKVIKIV